MVFSSRTATGFGRIRAAAHNQITQSQLFVPQNHELSSKVFQFSNISRPQMILQELHCRQTEVRLWALKGEGIFLQEMLKEHGYVVEPLAQRWQS